MSSKQKEMLIKKESNAHKERKGKNDERKRERKILSWKNQKLSTT
jgi:hypothetical protein